MKNTVKLREMEVGDLKAVCFEEVNIYECIGEMNYNDIYNGLLRLAPKEILKRKVKLIGASSSGSQEIEVY